MVGSAWTTSTASDAYTVKCTTTTSTGGSTCHWLDCGGTWTGANWSKLNYSYTFAKEDLLDNRRKIIAGKKTIELPDGAKLIVDDIGNYHIEDTDAKVTYKANRIREFSPYLNASDMLAKFVDYVRNVGLRKDDVLQLPIQLFIGWLVLEAAQRDGDPLPDGIEPLENSPLIKTLRRPRCLACGRFIRRTCIEQRFPFCGAEHGAKYIANHSTQLVIT